MYNAKQKDALKIRDEKGIKTPVAKRLLSVTQREAKAKLNSKNPNVKYKRPFDKNRPKQVRRVNKSSTITCLCGPCQNITLKSEVLQILSKPDENIPMLSKQDIIDLTV